MVNKIKILTTGLIICFCFISLVNASDDGLVAYYNFDEGEGNVLHDLSGNGNDGTIYGARWVDGKYGKALEFDGWNDYVDCGNDTSWDLGFRGTIMAWVQSKENDRNQVIAGTYSDDNEAYPESRVIVLDEKGYRLEKVEDNNFEFWVGSLEIWGGGYPSPDEFISSDIAYTDTNWHFVAGVLRKNTMYLYVDGQQQTDTCYKSCTDYAKAPFTIGARLDGNFSFDYFKGIIDEVRVYEKALTEEEIKEHMLSPSNDAITSNKVEKTGVDALPGGDAGLGIGLLITIGVIVILGMLILYFNVIKK